MMWIVDGWPVYGMVGLGRDSAATRGCTRSVLGGVIVKPYQSYQTGPARHQLGNKTLPTRQKKRKGQKSSPETHAVNALTTTLPMPSLLA